MNRGTPTLHDPADSRDDDRAKWTAWLPGLRLVSTYRRQWLRSDLVAGLSVAAVALPIGIAYAHLAGLPPVYGIYSCMLAPVAYALFGTSRQLIVNPDAAACTVAAATLAPLAAGDSARYLDLSIALTFLTGALCIIGGIAGLGAIANLLSRPILTGYLNGIAFSIVAGQLATLLGFDAPVGGFLRTLVYVGMRLDRTHAVTFAVGLSALVLLRGLRRFAPRLPAPLVAVSLAIVASEWLDLPRHGVAVVGHVPGGLPTPRVPSIRSGDLWPLALGSAGIMLVSFCSMMTTARAFAAKNGYVIDANKDMVALGASDLASAAVRGFVVSGADSRTAVADAAGGRTQLTSVVASAVIVVVLLLFTQPLGELPIACLGAILISSAIDLFDPKALREYRRVSRPEFRQSLVAMAGVMSIGVLEGVGLAVGLALLRVLFQAARPGDAILGIVAENGRSHAAREEDDGRPVEGLLIYRFDASLLFFNADVFTERVRACVAEASPKPRWVLLDAEAIALLDITGAAALSGVRDDLGERGIAFGIARAKGEFLAFLRRTGAAERIGVARIFPTVQAGVEAFQSATDDLSRRDASGV